MSYDFALACPEVTDSEGRPLRLARYDSLNYTSNVWRMYRIAFADERGVVCLDGLRGREAAPRLDAAVERMEENPVRFRRLDPPNGWGSYDGALEVLRTLRRWCGEVPEAVVEVSY